MYDIQNKLLIVDDTEANIDILFDALCETYDLIVATDGATAIDLAVSEQPDLILLDIVMPLMDGYQVCSWLKHHEATKDIPIIFLTAMNEIADKAKAFEAGAVDYITKPFEMTEVQVRIKNHLSICVAKKYLASQNLLLEEKVKERTEELTLTQSATIEAIACLAEHRDPNTGAHIRRTKEYVKILAMELKQHGPYTQIVDDDYIDMVYQSAPLHDIGKVGINDQILLKPSRLTESEFEIMKTHTTIGYEALRTATQMLGQDSFLKYALEIARSHQEKWDGSGYPDHLAGDEIPLSGRIMSLADIYDALTTRRPYKEPMSHEKSYDIIVSGSGKHFDPAIVEAFKSVHTMFRDIRSTFDDIYV